MRNHLHTIALCLLILALLIDLVLWGAVPDLPDVGQNIVRSANSEAILASTYIFLGGFLDSAISSLGNFGASVMTAALGQAFPQIIEEPSLAMDLILTSSFNTTHGWIKTLYWAPPTLFVAYVVLWLIRPKKVKLIRAR